MASPGAQMDLAELDTCCPASLDPALASANLAALAVDDAALADLVRAIRLPPAWRPVVALDNSVTYRVEPSGEAARWLGDTALPVTRAAARLQDFRAHEKNVALPGLAAGYELMWLLGHLPPHLAVYVFESDLRVLAAALRIHDLAGALAAGRCIFVVPGCEEKCVSALLARHPGLLPPGNIVFPDLVPPPRLAELRGLCERIHAEVLGGRGERLSALTRAAARQPRPVPTAPRLAVLALCVETDLHAVAREVARAAGSLGWPVDYCALDGPRAVHALPHCEALAAFDPDVSICIGRSASVLPMPIPGIVCTWHLAAAQVAAPADDDVILHLAASPQVARALQSVGVPPERLLNWYRAAGPSANEPAEARAAPPEPRRVLLAADLPERRPECHGLKQPSQQRLWTELLTVAARAWETPAITQPADLLRQAERNCRIAFANAELREALIRLIQHVIVPTAILDGIVATLRKERVAVRTLGHGWQRAAAPDLEPVGTSLYAWPDRGATPQFATCLFAAYADPLGPTILHAAAAGWPILVHAPAGQSLAADLGDVLRPGEHFTTVTSAADLRRALQLQRADELRARAASARIHVTEHHSYTWRLQQLGAFLRDKYRSSR